MGKFTYTFSAILDLLCTYKINFWMKNVELTEGWYLCIKDNVEVPMYRDKDGHWHLSAYKVEERQSAKPPKKVLKRMSR